MSLAAPAKINLDLAVVDRLPNGFHQIDTVFARLDLADEVEVIVEPSEEQLARAILEPPGSDAPPIDPEEFPLDERNLAVRAALLYLEAADLTAEVTVRIRKWIPIAAGLGGGSSDAAAVLRAMFGLLPADVDLHSLAASIGSDVAFFLVRHPALRGRGRGDELSSVSMPQVPVVLANPGTRISASTAYSLVESFGGPLEESDLIDLRALRARDFARNDLQAGVVKRYPEVEKVIDLLHRWGLRSVAMSGSGSTCFGIASDMDEARRVAALRRPYVEWTWAGLAAV